MFQQSPCILVWICNLIDETCCVFWWFLSRSRTFGTWHLIVCFMRRDIETRYDTETINSHSNITMQDHCQSVRFSILKSIICRITRAVFTVHRSPFTVHRSTITGSLVSSLGFSNVRFIKEFLLPNVWEQGCHFTGTTKAVLRPAVVSTDDESGTTIIWTDCDKDHCDINVWLVQHFFIPNVLTFDMFFNTCILYVQSKVHIFLLTLIRWHIYKIEEKVHQVNLTEKMKITDNYCPSSWFHAHFRQMLDTIQLDFRIPWANKTLEG